jgi:hypothetical protein
MIDVCDFNCLMACSSSCRVLRLTAMHNFIGYIYIYAVVALISIL